jgi:hypothetical protein
MSEGGFIQVRARLREMEALLYERAAGAADEIATYLETYSKTTAPFTDRTGNLRASIKGSATRLRRDLFTVILEATMEYAIFVELIREGKYAYIWPSIADNQGRIMEIWHKRLAL